MGEGKARKRIEQIEQSEGVMIFVFKQAGDDEDEPHEDAQSAVFVFAHSARSRQRALLRLIQAARATLSSFGELDPQVSEDDGILEDVVEFNEEDLAWLSGANDHHIHSVEAAS